ncbi:uncharacterized protein JCM6883_004229 [Sporobolomyces salmoneus]|uniref:uncharacterized protein n=1 Tax=Sporobolomyces salmoneus TaxID=183962 RepID=UPI00316B2938
MSQSLHKSPERSSQPPPNPNPTSIPLPPSPPLWDSNRVLPPPSPFPLPLRCSSVNDRGLIISEEAAEYFAGRAATSSISVATSEARKNPVRNFSASQVSHESSTERLEMRRSSEIHQGEGGALTMDSFFEQERQNAAMERLANKYRREGIGEIEIWSKSCWPRGPLYVERYGESEEEGEKEKNAKSSVHFVDFEEVKDSRKE